MSRYIWWINWQWITAHNFIFPYRLCQINKRIKKIGLSNIFVDYKVPTEIKLMADKRSVPLCLKLLESGSEKKRDIRLVIVGKKGAGKTSLVKRLFNEGKKGAGLTSFLTGFL